MQSTRKSSSTMKTLSLTSLFHTHADDVRGVSSGLDFLVEMRLRREQTSIKARKTSRRERTMTLEGSRRERTMTPEGSRKERTMILEQAFKII
jgi:hypothetical protein